MIPHVSRQQRAEGGDDVWCDEARRHNDGEDRQTSCEVREYSLPAGPVRAETSNGSVRITGERRNDIIVRAMVRTQARTAEAAREIAKQVTISTAGTIKAAGPRTEGREGWSVSFRIQTPQATDLHLSRPPEAARPAETSVPHERPRHD